MRLIAICFAFVAANSVEGDEAIRGADVLDEDKSVVLLQLKAGFAFDNEIDDGQVATVDEADATSSWVSLKKVVLCDGCATGNVCVKGTNRFKCNQENGMWKPPTNHSQDLVKNEVFEFKNDGSLDVDGDEFISIDELASILIEMGYPEPTQVQMEVLLAQIRLFHDVPVQKTPEGQELAEAGLGQGLDLNSSAQWLPGWGTIVNVVSHGVGFTAHTLNGGSPEQYVVNQLKDPWFWAGLATGAGGLKAFSKYKTIRNGAAVGGAIGDFNSFYGVSTNSLSIYNSAQRRRDPRRRWSYTSRRRYSYSYTPRRRRCPSLSSVPGRCGPLFGGGRCNLNLRNYALYCNTGNGWCGNTAAHKNAHNLKSNQKRCSNYKINGQWTRVWKSDISLDECAQACKRAGYCNIFSYGWESGKHNCLFNAPRACREESWSGYTTYTQRDQGGRWGDTYDWRPASCSSLLETGSNDTKELPYTPTTQEKTYEKLQRRRRSGNIHTHETLTQAFMLKSVKQTCIQIAGAGVGYNLQPITIGPCVKAYNQYWVQEGDVLKNPATGKCLCISGGGTPPNNNTPIKLFDCVDPPTNTTYTNTTWEFVYGNDGNFFFKNPSSQKCLTIFDGGKKPNTTITASSCSGWNAKFKMVNVTTTTTTT